MALHKTPTALHSSNIAVQSYGVPCAILDHTVLHATRHR